MKLADYINESAHHPADVFRCSASMMRVIDQAQRFDFGDDVITAVVELLKSKPSTLEAALPLCHLPYRTMWWEWRGGQIDFSGSNQSASTQSRSKEIAPIPSREGMLIEEIKPRAGCITTAWAHHKNQFPDDRDDKFFSGLKHLTNVCPLGIFFDFTGETNLTAMINAVHEQACMQVGDRRFFEVLYDWIRKKPDLNEETAKVWMTSMLGKGWHRLANDPKEVNSLINLERLMKIGITPHGFHMAKTIFDKGSVKDISAFMENWKQDIQGGGAIMRCILALLNTKNLLSHSSEDMSRLNKARVKSGKRPVISFTTTRLTMSKAYAKAAGKAGLTREEARLHLVRGHLKVRKTGIFWWSPFPRGNPTKPVERRGYEVK